MGLPNLGGDIGKYCWPFSVRAVLSKRKYQALNPNKTKRIVEIRVYIHKVIDSNDYKWKSFQIC